MDTKNMIRLIMVEQIDGIISGYLSMMEWQALIVSEKYEIYNNAPCWYVDKEEFFKFLKNGAKDDREPGRVGRKDQELCKNMDAN